MKKLILALLVAFGGVQTATAVPSLESVKEAFGATVASIKNIATYNLIGATATSIRNMLKHISMANVSIVPYSLENAMDMDNIAEKHRVSLSNIEKNIKAVFELGFTPLHVACKGTYEPKVIYLNVVKWLLENGAKTSINKADDFGCTPLLNACTHGNLELVELLFEYGAKESINKADNRGRVPFSNACDGGGNLELVQWLLDKGAQASINQVDITGLTALCKVCIIRLHSAEYQNMLVELLLKHGAYESVNRQISRGRTAFGVATDDVKRLLIVYKLAHENPQFLQALQKEPKEKDGVYSDKHKIEMLNALTQEQRELLNTLFENDVNSALQTMCNQWLTDRANIKDIVAVEANMLVSQVANEGVSRDSARTIASTPVQKMDGSRSFLLWTLLTTPNKYSNSHVSIADVLDKCMIFPDLTAHTVARKIPQQYIDWIQFYNLDDPFGLVTCKEAIRKEAAITIQNAFRKWRTRVSA